MPDNIEQPVETGELDQDGNPVVTENANADSLSPGGGTAGAGDTKSQKIAAIITNLTSKSDEDINGFLASLSQIGKEAEGVGDVAGKNKSSITAKPSDASAETKKVIKEDLTKLFEGEEGLTEGFIDQATTLFEAAVTARVGLETSRVEDEFNTRLEEQTESMVAEFAERLDTYLDYVAEKWLEENKVALETGIKTELTEGFIAGLKDLFVEHYIDIPEDKVDVVESLTAELEETRSQLNDQINENIELSSAQEKAALGSIVTESSEGLTDADAERLANLAEDLDYTDVEDFKTKVGLLRERFFDAKPAANPTGLVIEEVGLVEAEPVEEVQPTDRMSRYVAQIKKDVTA
jgi:hypothetical protein